jgi:hypothetical protein
MKGLYRTGFDMLAARQADFGALPCLVGLAVANPQP